MTKKKWIILIGAALCILLIVVLVKCSGKEIVYLEEPDPEFYPYSYDFVMDRFADSTSGKKIEPVTDYEDAAQKGLRLLKEDNREDGCWIQWLWGGDTITVFYVPEEDTWVWIGSCPCIIREDVPHWMGCHPVVIIQSDGTVVAQGSY